MFFWFVMNHFLFYFPHVKTLKVPQKQENKDESNNMTELDICKTTILMPKVISVHEFEKSQVFINMKLKQDVTTNVTSKIEKLKPRERSESPKKHVTFGENIIVEIKSDKKQPKKQIKPSKSKANNQGQSAQKKDLVLDLPVRKANNSQVILNDQIGF